MAIESTVKGQYLMYKGKPLVREGNQICYGSMQDEYILYMMILSNKKIKVGDRECEVPDRVIVQVLERMVKQFDKKSLYEAFNDGLIYLERQLAK